MRLKRVWVLLLLAGSTQAAIVPEPAPLDQVLARWMKEGGAPSSQAAALARFEKDGVLGALEKLAGDAVWGDVVAWQLYRAGARACEKALAGKKWDEAARLAKTIFTALEPMESRWPESPYLKRIDEARATTEELWAAALGGRGDAKAAVERAGRAFARWMSLGRLGRISRERTEAFGKWCAKAPSPNCEVWVRRFESGAGRGFEKQTQNYKLPDADGTAIDAALGSVWAGRDREADSRLHTFLDEFPRSVHRYRARYWLARVLKNLGDTKRAAAMFQTLAYDAPLSFYGLASALEVGLPVAETLDGGLPAASPDDPRLLPPELHRLKRARELAKAGALEAAAEELRELRPREVLGEEFVAFLAVLQSDLGNHGAAFVALTEVFQRGSRSLYNSTGVRLVFPVVYWPEVQKYAAAAGVDPILALSLAKQESAFDSETVSSAGATGLMQLLPSTAAETVPGLDADGLADPEKNLQAGTKYLRQLLDRYKGNIVKALAAYNAGPTAVDRWMKGASGEMDTFRFIELIGYRETREYVSTILRNYYWYSRKLSDQPFPGWGYFWK